MKQYVISIASFTQRFDKILTKLSEGYRIILTYRKNVVGEFVLDSGFNLKHDVEPEITPEKRYKLPENKTKLQDKIPPAQDTKPQTTDFPWEENHGDMDEKLARLLAAPAKKILEN